MAAYLLIVIMAFLVAQPAIVSLAQSGVSHFPDVLPPCNGRLYIDCDYGPASLLV